MESQQKEEALTKVEALNGRVAELQLQAQDTLEKIQTTEQEAAELQLQLEAEAQQKHDAIEKVEMFELRVADLERQLEEQSHSQSESDEQVCFHVPALWPHTHTKRMLRLRVGRPGCETHSSHCWSVVCLKPCLTLFSRWEESLQKPSSCVRLWLQRR